MTTKASFWTTWLIGAVAILAVAAAIWLWLHPRTNTVTVSKTQYQMVSVDRVVETIRTVRVPMKAPEVTAYDKAAVVEKLPDLPAALKGDRNEQVVASAEIPDDEGGAVSAVAFLNMTTGHAQIVAKALPPPFFALENHGDAGVRYGLDQRLNHVGAVDGRWTFLRVGSVHLGLYGEITTGADARIMADVAYHW